MYVLSFAVHDDVGRATSACCGVNYPYVHQLLDNGGWARQAGRAYEPILAGMEACQLLMAAAVYEQP